jgi:hypothetical protein
MFAILKFLHSPPETHSFTKKISPQMGNPESADDPQVAIRQHAGHHPAGTLFGTFPCMKTAFLFCLLHPLVALGQLPDNRALHQQRADSIVAFFLGTEIFDHYVKSDPEKSKQMTDHTFFFQYNFRHPKFSGLTFFISFTLDSVLQFVPDEKTHGLIRITAPIDSAWITARQALYLCRDQAYRIKKNTLRLAWDHTDVSYDIFQQTHDYRDIVPGEMVWQVDGEVLFRRKKYRGTFEVNVFNGRVTRRFAIPWD